MLEIGSKSIGSEALPYIIAEIGVNHDGKLNKAMAMVTEAASAGADAIKMQYFKADMLMSNACKLAAYQSAAGEDNPIEMLRRLELSVDEMSQIVDHAHAANLQAIVSIFSVDLVQEITELPWDALKSASPDIINTPLLREMTKSDRPLIISTGAANEQEIRFVIGKYASALLHCVSAYPTPLHAAQLAGISAIKQLVCELYTDDPSSHIPTGYSDHTSNIFTGGLAVIAGATILEKHFTYDCSAAGPDHKASLDCKGLTEYIQFAHQAWHSIGRQCICVQDIEKDVRNVSRQSVITTHHMQAGSVLTKEDITIQRPGTGISPQYFDSVIGCTLKTTIPAHMPVTTDDIVEALDYAQ